MTTDSADKYVDFVEHPRYGRQPNYTGLNPDPFAKDVDLHWNATNLREIKQRYQALTGEKWPNDDLTRFDLKIARIPNTAIVADLTRQTPATVAVTHYFDLEQICRDCGRPFIFFAEEQKHWYEELGFGLTSGCVRCIECRKRQQGISQKRQRYEELFHIQKRTHEQNLEMADCCLSLIESATFSPRQTQRVRMLLNLIRSDTDEAMKSRCHELLSRIKSIESKDHE